MPSQPLGRFRTFSRLWQDTTASISLLGAVAGTVLIGFAGLALDVSYWEGSQNAAQGAADAAAISASVAAQAGTGWTHVQKEAKAIAGSDGFVDGTKGVTVTVNSPPTSGSNTKNASAYEVIVTQPQPRFFSPPFVSSVSVSARAVAATKGQVCMLALDNVDKQIHTFFVTGTSSVVTLNHCTVADNLPGKGDSVDIKSTASLTVEGLYLVDGSACDGGVSPIGNCNGTLNVDSSKVQYNQPAVQDPYSAYTIPAFSGCGGGTNLVVSTTQTLSPGVYCSNGGNAALTISGGTTMTGGNGSTGKTQITYGSTVSGITSGMVVTDQDHPTAIPAGTTVTSVSGKIVNISAATTSPGVGGGDTLQYSPAGGVTVTLNPGIYILDGGGGGNCTGSSKSSSCLSGDLIISNGATVQGSGVTIILTSSIAGQPTYIGNVQVDDSSTLSLSAPSSGASQGIALWQDANAPYPGNPGGGYSATAANVNTIGAGASANITGAIYFPSQAVVFSGGSGTACTQIVAWAIQFLKNAQFTYGNCSGTGIQAIGNSTPKLLE